MKVDMTTPARQQGMALVMGLIILLVMTLISVSAMRSTLMQERMAGSFQGQQLSFQAAEAALQKAKRDLGDGTLPNFGQGGFYLRGDASHGPPPDWADPDAPITGKPVETYSQAVSDDVARDPQYAIVRLPGSCTEGAINASGKVDRNAFRVMTRGFGASENSQTVLESYYCR
jgi:type IV pilus assembly protein PilX